MIQKVAQRISLNDSPVRQFPQFQPLLFSDDYPLIEMSEKNQQEKETGIKQNSNQIPILPKPQQKSLQNLVVNYFRERPKNKILPKSHRDKLLCYINSKRCQKGNKNFVKFLIREFFAHYKQLVQPDDFQYLSYLRQMKKKICEGGVNHISRKHLCMLMGDGKNQQNGFEKRTRLMIRDICSYRKYIQKDIFQSNFIKRKADKKQQLFATKVYSLRCINQTLACRLQSR